MTDEEAIRSLNKEYGNNGNFYLAKAEYLVSREKVNSIEQAIQSAKNREDEMSRKRYERLQSNSI